MRKLPDLSAVTGSFPDDVPESSRERGLAGRIYFVKERLKEYLDRQRWPDRTTGC